VVVQTTDPPLHLTLLLSAFSSFSFFFLQTLLPSDSSSFSLFFLQSLLPSAFSLFFLQPSAFSLQPFLPSASSLFFLQPPAFSSFSTYHHTTILFITHHYQKLPLQSSYLAPTSRSFFAFILPFSWCSTTAPSCS
jgi:hypothetical protein